MREIMLGIALAAIASGIFRLLSPNGSFKKQTALLISCFFVLSCVSLVTGKTELPEIAESFRQQGAYADFTEEAENMLKTETANRLAEKLGEILDENEIPPREIRVIVDISSERSISIKEIRLSFSAENAGEAEKAREITEKEAGGEIIVVTEIKG